MAKKLPKISIVTPTLNQVDFIEQTIQSVLRQNYPNLEHIVIDGGSKDGTISILRKYQKYLKWISGKDKGQSDAINKGIKLSTGEIVGYLNSDDILENGTLLKIAEFFTRNPQVSWVTGKCYIINSNGKRIRYLVNWYKNIYLKIFRFPNALLITNYISQPATFWRKEIIEKIGLFDIYLHYSMDYDYWLRIWRYYKLEFINEYLASFRLHKTSKTSANLSAQLSENYEVIRKYSSSNLIVNFHKFHDKIIYFLYNLFGN